MSRMQSYMIISEIVLMPVPTDKFVLAGLIPCDGRELKVEDYGALYVLIGSRYGERIDSVPLKPVRYFNIPKLDCPLPGYCYYICVEGEFPQRT